MTLILFLPSQLCAFLAFSLPLLSHLSFPSVLVLGPHRQKKSSGWNSRLKRLKSTLLKSTYHSTARLISTALGWFQALSVDFNRSVDFNPLLAALLPLSLRIDPELKVTKYRWNKTKTHCIPGRKKELKPLTLWDRRHTMIVKSTQVISPTPVKKN